MAGGWGVEIEGMQDVQSNLEAVAAAYGSMRSHVVASDVEYAVYVEFGTGPHIIRPKEGGTLAFEVGGETVFAKEVKHPGTPPNGALRKAVRTALANLDAIVANANTPDEITKELAEFIARNWRQDVWVDTGRLRQSIHVEAVG